MCSCTDNPTSNIGSTTLGYHLVRSVFNFDLLAGAFFGQALFGCSSLEQALGCCLVLQKKAKFGKAESPESQLQRFSQLQRY